MVLTGALTSLSRPHAISGAVDAVLKHGCCVRFHTYGNSANQCEAIPTAGWISHTITSTSALLII